MDDVGALMHAPHSRSELNVDWTLTLRCCTSLLHHRRPSRVASFRRWQQSGSRAARSPSASAAGLVRDPARSPRSHARRLTTWGERINCGVVLSDRLCIDQRVNAYACISTCVCARARVCVRMCVRVGVHTHIHAYKHTHAPPPHTHARTHTHTHTHTHIYM